MTLTTLLRAFKTLLKTLQKTDTSHLGYEMTHINIWVPISLSHNLGLLMFLQMAKTTVTMVSK